MFFFFSRCKYFQLVKIFRFLFRRPFPQSEIIAELYERLLLVVKLEAKTGFRIRYFRHRASVYAVAFLYLDFRFAVFVSEKGEIVRNIVKSNPGKLLNYPLFRDLYFFLSYFLFPLSYALRTAGYPSLSADK